MRAHTFGLLNQAEFSQNWHWTLSLEATSVPSVTNGWLILKGRQEARHLIEYPEIKYG